MKLLFRMKSKKSSRKYCNCEIQWKCSIFFLSFFPNWINYCLPFSPKWLQFSTVNTIWRLLKHKWRVKQLMKMMWLQLLRLIDKKWLESFTLGKFSVRLVTHSLSKSVLVAILCSQILRPIPRNLNKTLFQRIRAFEMDGT